MAFESTAPSGAKFVMDAYPEVGGDNRGQSPVEALLSSAAACMAMDVISILHKKQQVVTSYEIEVDGERASEGEWPRPFRSITIKHSLKGDNLDPIAVARAIELSDQKYCTVVATLRSAPTVTSEWTIE